MIPTDENYSKTSIINSVKDHGPSVPKTEYIERENSLLWMQIEPTEGKERKKENSVYVKLDRR